MRRYLLDTGIASDLINRRGDVEARAREASRRGDRLGVSTPVLGELVAGIENSNNPDRNRKELWHGLQGITLWPFDKAAAEEFGRLYATLRRLGRPMQQIDIQTAAIALTLGNCTVVTKDSDFGAVPGLHVADWSKAESA
jgi:tRNA(fMet)-specific endonuclease VapC